MAKLHYYGAQGRGQQIRWVLAEGGIEWEDESAPFPPTPELKVKWQNIGGNTTTNVPMLEMDGRVYTQSSAVLRVAGRKGGLMPVDEYQQYQVDNVIAAVEDYRSEGYKVIFPALMGNPDTEANLVFKTETLPRHFGNLERLLGDNDFFVGDAPTIADMTTFDVLNNFGFNIFPSTKESFPKLLAFYDRIAARPNIAAYMASEKYTALMAFPCLE